MCRSGMNACQSQTLTLHPNRFEIRGWLPQSLTKKIIYLANKKELEKLEKRIELLEMQVKELKTVEPDVINERFKEINEALYSTKDILNMKEVGLYLDISQSLLYKLTCNGEIPHFKPRGKMIFFEKNRGRKS